MVVNYLLCNHLLLLLFVLSFCVTGPLENNECGGDHIHNVVEKPIFLWI
jgi:hypothetical protein